MKKNILITHVSMGMGGIEKKLLSLLDNIDYKKYNIDLVLYKKNGLLLENIPKDVNVKLFSNNMFIMHLMRYDNFIYKIIRKFIFNSITASLFKTKKQYDVAIAKAGYHPFIDLIAAHSKANKKYIEVHADYFYQKEKNKLHHFKTKKKIYQKFDKIIGVSQHSIDSLAKLFPEYKYKMTYIWNLADEIIINKNNKNDSDIKLISVGRFVEEKNFELLIEAHKLLIDQGYPIITTLVGDGKLKLKYINLINKYHINSTFILPGEVNADPYIKNSDIYIMTSESESFGNVLIESLVHGVPFITVDNGGGTEIAQKIAPQNSSIIIKNDKYVLKDAIINMINIKPEFRFNVKKYNKTIKKELDKMLRGEL